MGLAASQAHLLTITARKDDVEFAMMKIARNKIDLSRDTTEISEKYQNALDQRKLQWSLDGTDTNTQDLNYDFLMTPNATSIASQYIIADGAGKVVLSSDYTSKLGLAATGKPGELTIPQNQFLVALMGPPTITTAQADAFIAGRTVGAGTSGGDYSSIDANIKQLGSAMSDKEFAAVASYTLTEPVYKEMKAALEGLGKSIDASLKSTALTADDKATFEKMKIDVAAAKQALEDAHNADTSNGEGQNAAMAAIAALKSIFNGTKISSSLPDARVHPDSRHMDGTPDTAKSWGSHKKTNTQGWIVNSVADNYFNESTGLGKTGYNTYYTNNIVDLSKSLGTSTSSTTPPAPLVDQDKANFYLNLYDAIKTNGWTANANIKNSGYLENGIRSGTLFLKKLNTGGTASALSLGDPTNPIRDVKDKDGIAEAEAEYETEKSKIETKEMLYDLEQKNLDTERTALDTEIDSVKGVISKNIERSQVFKA